jgi:Zn-dependent peptidase ImmA (M78 family)
MAKSIPALVEPKLLRWTRENSGIAFDTIEARIGVDESTVKKWEAGHGNPTMAQLRKLGELYKFPIAVFYLSEPPEDSTRMEDFRRLPSKQSSTFSPQLRLLIRQTRYRQDWLRDFRLDSDFHEIKFVGSQSEHANSTELGKSIRATLGISIDEQRSWISRDAAFGAWLQRVEAIGICVFQPSEIEVEEMRGFALPDPIAPVVVINSNDFRSSRIFTLLHEVAHVALGQPGISNMVFRGGKEQQIEVLCNAAAAEALVPSGDFKSMVKKSREIQSDATIQLLATHYRVSEEVIVRRMYDLDFVSRSFYESKRAEYASRKPPKQKGPVKIPRARIVMRNNGRAFSITAVSAFHSGNISGGELSDLLNMKVDHLQQLEAEI